MYAQRAGYNEINYTENKFLVLHFFVFHDVMFSFCVEFILLEHTHVHIQCKFNSFFSCLKNGSLMKTYSLFLRMHFHLSSRKPFSMDEENSIKSG